MALSDSLKKEYCFYPVKGDNKKEVLEDLVTKFAERAGLDTDKKDEILSAVMKREALFSTGLEEGVAIPHAKLKSLEHTVAAVGVGEKEIDYGSADGKPTNVYFLVLGSEANPSDHVAVLSQIARLATSSATLRLIKTSRSETELQDVFFDI